MNRTSAILSLICLLASSLFTPLRATVYVDNGSNSTYNLNSGDSLSIASGTFTGSITTFSAGAKIAVAAGAVFQPASIGYPQTYGTIYVYGTFRMNSQFRTNTNFALNNYGVVEANSALMTKLNGNSQLWTNFYGGVMKFTGDVQINTDNKMVNQGTIEFKANLEMTGTSAITNKNVITVAGNYTNSGGTLNNLGRFETKGSLTFNNGLAIVNNYCRLTAEGGIYNTTGSLFNYNLLWSKSSAGSGTIVNSGSITNGPAATIKGVTFNNTGKVTGSGYLYFTGSTTTTNLGTTGVSGTTSDTIRFYDVTRANALTIYDNQTGIVHPNVVYQVLSAPDTTSTFLVGCAAEVVEIPLPVKWNYFVVSELDNVPVLNWSAQFTPGTVFEIQRSFDGSGFETIKTMEAENGKSEYYFKDGKLIINSAIVYYRIKANETAGGQKFSQIRSLKFTNNKGITLQFTPSPFTGGGFNINYNSQERGNIVIRVFNLNGQEKLYRTAAVYKGYNRIPVNGLSHFAGGVYLVQLTQGNLFAGTGKIIKQ